MSDELRKLARRHLVPHFTAAGAWRGGDFPIIVRGDGCYVYDDGGNRFLDGLSGLFCVNIGHGRDDIAAAAAEQMRTLAYATNWGSAHPSAIDAARTIAELAPGDADAVFFVNSGSEAVESAVKFARQYHRAAGEPQRTKIIARDMAYHGTTLGALSVTGIPGYREPFQPLLPDVRHVPNTLGATVPPGGSAADLDCVRAIEEVIAQEGPETIAALFAEPVQNSRGALVPPDGYWQALRDICDAHGILLVADEVINAFGRLGHWFGSAWMGVVPDVITFAKGATSGYAPLGGIIVRSPLVERLFEQPGGMFTHGATWGGHPVATAVAIANLTALRDEGIVPHVAEHGPALRAGLEELAQAHPIVKEVRGAGYFYAIELTGDRESGRELTDEQSAILIREVLPAAMRDVGLITRPDGRGATMIMIAPPLVADRAVLDELVGALEHTVGAAENWLRGPGRVSDQ